MNCAEFVAAAGRRAGVPPEQAHALTRATLETLADRISGGQAREVAAQLPPELRDYLRKEQEFPEPFGLGQFIRRVSDRAGVNTAQGSAAVRAVLATVRQAITGTEFEDVVSQLPKEYWEVITPVGVEVGVRRGRR
ncbi:Uncharacterized conserved protein, DUF2267 family [Micromonospora pattaloongensis]|uniref:Uncharacterized conserved protein, DUF2267 family n=1 Tax=Micromonospora pattaloongensis TaxID=405436 RepID=A0A1H3PA89_9ACTN|nr:DUF2267 domain-containing protein [Micromonospora pattaloongensis]SDY97735.1 Uncharacterized conserved protein, DUF2267 family [Micromonospora pattaloongensis]